MASNTFMISQLFILSPRGDVIIRREFLGDVPRNSPELFFRHCRLAGDGEEGAPPVFAVDGVTYMHTREGGLQLVATTRQNVSPSLYLEFLRRLCTIIKDYCGLLTEDAVRKNFVLIYELLDEVMDYGVPQITSTDYLKTFVLNQPVVIAPPSSSGPGRLLGFNKGPTGVFKSVLDTSRTDGGKRKDEIFVDVVERVTCTFNASGYIVSQQVDGSVQIKSYLAGNPPIKIKLNDDLIIGKRDNPYGGARRGGGDAGNSVYLDDCSFHECANLEAFDSDRSITLVPPDGEFALINYRTTSGFKPPFRLQSVVEPDPITDNKALLTVRVWCEVPPDKGATWLEVEVPTPKYVQRAHCDFDNKVAAATQSWDYSEKTHLLKWKFKKCNGGHEFTLRAKLTLERPYGPSLRTEIGPINLKFTVPMYSASRINLKYLQILKKNADKNYNPFRWVRYVTSSSSYTFRT